MIPFMLIWNVINMRPEWVATPIYDRVRTSILLGFDETTNPIYRGYEFFGQALGVANTFRCLEIRPRKMVGLFTERRCETAWCAMCF